MKQDSLQSDETKNWIEQKWMWYFINTLPNISKNLFFLCQYAVLGTDRWGENVFLAFGWNITKSEGVWILSECTVDLEMYIVDVAPQPPQGHQQQHGYVPVCARVRDRESACQTKSPGGSAAGGELCLCFLISPRLCPVALSASRDNVTHVALIHSNGPTCRNY